MKKIICIGGALVDETFTCRGNPVPGTSNPADYFRSPGGVAHNVAHNLSQLGNAVELISHLGNDSDGKWLSDKCSLAGIGLSHSVFNDKPTGRYSAILSPDGNLFTGAAAMHFETEITREFLVSKMEILKSASLIMADCNLSIECIIWLTRFCRDEEKSLVIDPVSVAKARKLSSISLEGVLMLSPNKEELQSICVSSYESDPGKMAKEVITRGAKLIWMRNGRAGSRLFSDGETISLPASPIELTDVTGAGDAALAGWIHYFLKGKNITDCLRAGHAMAELILQSKGSIHERLDERMLLDKIE